jgi:hypothetical protein
MLRRREALKNLLELVAVHPWEHNLRSYESTDAQAGPQHNIWRRKADFHMDDNIAMLSASNRSRSTFPDDFIRDEIEGDDSMLFPHPRDLPSAQSQTQSQSDSNVNFNAVGDRAARASGHYETEALNVADNDCVDCMDDDSRDLSL